MRKLFLFVVLTVLVFACGNRQNQIKTAEDTVVVLTVDELMASPANYVDQEVVISGLITHVCKHGGQRCFVMGASDDVSIRVEAGDEIDAFKQEHVGDELKITGILRLVPVDGGHACSEDEKSAQSQTQETAQVGEDVVEESPAEEYVPRYYIDGIRFVVVAEGEESADEA
jgi:hypothetical protein